MARLVASSWSSTDVLRVALDGDGVIGFIEVSSNTSLQEARHRICSEVEGIQEISSSNFIFLLPDRVPISKKQEPQILAKEFLPMVLIRAKRDEEGKPEVTTTESKELMTMNKHHSKNSQSSDLSKYKVTSLVQKNKNVMIPGRSNMTQLLNNKVTVNFLGELYNLYITADYSFAQLRREAARYWSLPAEQVVLMDEDGCSWPESALVSAVQEMGILDQKKIVLVRKPRPENGNTRTYHAGHEYGESYEMPRSPQSGITINNILQNNVTSPQYHHQQGFASPMGSPKNSVGSRSSPKPMLRHSDGTRQLKQLELQSPSASSSGGDLNDGNSYSSSMAPAVGQRMSTDLERSRHVTNEPADDTSFIVTDPPNNSHQSIVLERYAQLWRVFTFYCVQIDSLRPMTMDRRGFIGLLQDCKLVDHKRFSPAMLNLIFASNCKSGTQSNKMEFDDFLDALLEITRRLHAPKQDDQSLTRLSTPKRNVLATKRSNKVLMTRFVQLLVQRLLPLCANWNIRKWERHGQLSERRAVLRALRPFVEPIYDIFRFYAPAVASNKLDMDDDVCFNFNTFTAFALDFEFANLGIRPQLAEIFLCCSQYQGVKVQSKRNGLKLDLLVQNKQESSSSSSSTNSSTTKGKAELKIVVDDLQAEDEQEEVGEDFESGVENDDVDTVENKSFVAEAEENQREEKSFFCFEHSDGTPVWDRPVLYFGQFLDALLRVAYFAFPEIADAEPERAFKALLQHFSKCLRRSYVMQLVAKRRNLSTYPLGLMQGTNQLYRRYVTMWKSEGQPDYLSLEGSLPHGKDLVNGNILPTSPKNKTGGMRSPLSSPTKLVNGSGRKVLKELLAAERTSDPSNIDESNNEASKAVSALLGLGVGNDRDLEHPNSGDIGTVSSEDYARFGFLEDVENSGPWKHLEGEFNVSAEGSELNTTGGGSSFHTDRSIRPNSPRSRGLLGEEGLPRSPKKATEVRSQQNEEYLQSMDKAKLAANGGSFRSGHELDSEIEEEKFGAEDENSFHSNQAITLDEFEPKRGDGHQIESKDGEIFIQSSTRTGRVSKTTYDLLCKGGVFLKYGRRGYPHKRYIWCDENLEKVYWCPFEKKAQLDKNHKFKAKHMRLDDIDLVQPGCETKVFQNYVKPSSSSTEGETRPRSRSWSIPSLPGVRLSRHSTTSQDAAAEQQKRMICFSLVGSNRTLDLESDSNQMRNQWVQAFQQAVSIGKPTNI